MKLLFQFLLQKSTKSQSDESTFVSTIFEYRRKIHHVSVIRGLKSTFFTVFRLGTSQRNQIQKTTMTFLFYFSPTESEFYLFIMIAIDRT